MRTSRGWMVPALLLVLGVSIVAEAQWVWTPQTRRWINVKRLPKETAELQAEYVRSCLLAGDEREAWRQSEKFTRYYADSPFADQNQFLRGEIRVAQKRWIKAAQEFQKVLSVYPSTALYDEAIRKQYEIGDRFYDKGDKNLNKWWKPFRKRPFKKAIKVYSMVIENQPFTAAAAEAQYKLGLCHAARKEYIEAAFEYRRVIEDYAGSEWVREACHGLVLCYYNASLPATHDQTSTELCVRAADVFLERYPEDERVKAVRETRQEMRDRIALQRLNVARFYEKRQQLKSARIYYALLAEQYADTASAEPAQQWLEQHPVVETPIRREITELREAAE